MTALRIIITGTAGSGKTSIVRAICSEGPYQHVRAVTSRPARADDRGEYEYLSEDAFAVLDDATLLVKTDYRGHKYGIRKSEVQEIENSGRIPILTLTPESASILLNNAPNRARYLSFFVDAPDLDLESRLLTRTGSTQQTLTQQKTDRDYKYAFTYAIQNVDLVASVALIRTLIDIEGKSGILSARIVKMGLVCGVFLENASTNNVPGASYDLSLGDEYFYGGRIRKLSDSEPILMVEPYDYAIVTSHELAHLPLNVCGRFDLAVNLFAQGMILSNGPQIDPGFRGPLFCLLFNTSSSPILLKRKQHYATLELHKIIESTEPYRGQYQAKKLLDYLPANAARGAINELKREVESLRSESRNLQAMILAVISLVLAVVAIWVSLK